MSTTPGRLPAGGPPRNGRVAVIGGGYAGLSAAVDLVDAGIPVTVFEAGPVLGGRARRIPGGDGTDDNGQHLLIGAYSELLGLMRRLNIPAEELLARRRLTLKVSGGVSLAAWPLPAPFNLAAGILFARGVPLRERIATLRALDGLRGNGFRAPPGETVAGLLDQLGMAGRLRRDLWESICLAALNTPAERACAQTFLNILHDIATGPASASHLLIPRCDLSNLLPEPAAAHIRARGGQVRTQSAVLRLDPVDGGVRVIGADSEDVFRRVIVATAPSALARLLGNWPDLRALLAGLADMPFERIATLTVEYPCPVRLPFPMMGVADGSVEWVFDRRWLLDGASGKPGRLSCVLSAPEIGVTLDREALTERAHADIQRLAGPLPEPESSRLVVEKRATFSCRPGIFRPDTVTADDRILLAGDYLASRYPATLETAVRSGRRASAVLIQERLGGGAAARAQQDINSASRQRPAAAGHVAPVASLLSLQRGRTAPVGEVLPLPGPLEAPVRHATPLPPLPHGDPAP